MQVNAVQVVPLESVEIDLVGALRPAQHVGKQDAVVVAIGLVTEHGDVELLGAATCQHFLDSTGTGHAVANDDQALLTHPNIPRRLRRCGGDAGHGPHRISMKPMSRTSVPATSSGAAIRTSILVSGRRSSTTASGHVHGALGAEREVAQRLAVAGQDQGHQIIGRAARPESRSAGRAGRPARRRRGHPPAAAAWPRPAPEKVNTPWRKRAIESMDGLRLVEWWRGKLPSRGALLIARSPPDERGTGHPLDAHRADLELRDLRGRIERVVGQQVGAGATAPVERHEDRVERAVTR